MSFQMYAFTWNFMCAMCFPKLLLALFVLQLCQGGDFIQVKVEEGLFEGQIVQRSTGNGQYCSFKGIPYAQPPVGTLRFKAPKPPLPWKGVKQAREHGPVCPQVIGDTGQYLPGDEDCLTLNVYTPTLKPNHSRPVMIFIHGGCFKSGSGNDDNYGPDFLMNDDVILVTINYRLGILGFLSLDIEEVPGNAGMKDQVAAIRWVNKNIAVFGGDPNNVTLIGQSVGGTSVAMHALSPLTKGLFRRGIAMSGVALSDYGYPFEPKRHAFTLCSELGFYTQDPVEAFKFLQNASVESIVKAKPYVLLVEKYKITETQISQFVPVVEKDFGGEHFLTECPLKLLKTRKVHDVEMMVGYTSQEAIYNVFLKQNLILKYMPVYRELLLPITILYARNPKEILRLADRVQEHYLGNKQISLETMKEYINYDSSLQSFDIYRFAEMWPNKIYFYEFSYYSERNVYGKYGLKYGIKAASHGDDLMYLFDAKKYNLTLHKNSDSYKMVVQECELFTNFAKYGNPTPDKSLGVTWEEYQPCKNYLQIDHTLKQARINNTSEFYFWKSIFESTNLTYV